MKVGLGTGSTAAKFVDLVGQRVKAGLKITCVPTSEATRVQAERLGIALTTLDKCRSWISRSTAPTSSIRAAAHQGRRRRAAARENRGHGVRAHDRHCRCLQARGHARQISAPRRGGAFRTGHNAQHGRGSCHEAGCEGEIKLRPAKDGQPFVTDGGNLLFDCVFGRIDKPEMLDQALKRVPGVVENGMFLGIADVAIVAGPDGVVVLGAQLGREIADTTCPSGGPNGKDRSMPIARFSSPPPSPAFSPRRPGCERRRPMPPVSPRPRT